MCKLFSHRRTQDLYVITTIFNPQRYKSRISLYKEFEERMLEAGVTLIVVEANLRHHHPEITERKSKKHHIVHVDAECELWLKENLINIGIEYLTGRFPDWKYVAWIDADLAFVRPDWVKETKKLLHKYPIIQMFSHLVQLGKNYEQLHGHNLSFMEGWSRGLAIQNKKPSGEDPTKMRYGWCGAPGGAWAASRECIDRIFPLLDIGILGSGDFHMAAALMQYADMTLTYTYTDGYKYAIHEWQKKVKWLCGNVGHMKGLILHYWHGAIKNRGYDVRWSFLVKHFYNPYLDLKKNKQGVYFIPKKEALIADIQKYFQSRKEDEI